MKKENGRWTDEKRNTWDATVWTEDQAEQLSKSLINCSGCRDCSNCSYCSNCGGCSNCMDCGGCSNCMVCSNCRGCSGCSYCSYCKDCSGCSYCKDCSGFKSNPKRYTGDVMGSRCDQTTTYWIEGKTQVVCGCFIGTIEEFKKRVEVVHGDNVHGKAYKKYIAIVEMIIKEEVKEC